MSRHNSPECGAASQPGSPSLGYFLPEHAQYQLARLQDLLGLLSRVTAPRTTQEERASSLNISASELSHLLYALADQVRPVLSELEGPAHVTLTYDEPR